MEWFVTWFCLFWFLREWHYFEDWSFVLAKKWIIHSFNFSKLSFFINFHVNIFAALGKEHISKSIFPILIPQYPEGKISNIMSHIKSFYIRVEKLFIFVLGSEKLRTIFKKLTITWSRVVIQDIYFNLILFLQWFTTKSFSCCLGQGVF